MSVRKAKTDRMPGAVVLLAVTWLLLAAGGVRAAEAQPVVDRADPGPHTVTVRTGVWTDRARADRDVPWKLYFPETTTGPVPVVVWSHGLGGSRDGGEYLGRHLASHGYAAFHVQHAGSDTEVMRRGRAALLAAVADPDVSLQRFLDIPFVVTEIRAMAGEGEFAGRLDSSRMGMSGHSYGSVSTLVAAGQRTGPSGLSFAVDAFRGAFAMSPAPPRGADPSAAYANMRMPIFHLTGTEDGTPLGDDLRPIDRRIPFDTIDGVDQYLLILDKGVHSTFSGRLDRPYPGIDRHHALIRMAALVFWDATLREDAAARAWLEGGGYAAQVGASGTFEVKTAAP